MREEVKIELLRLSKKERIIDFIKYLVKVMFKAVIKVGIIAVLIMSAGLFMPEHGFITIFILCTLLGVMDYEDYKLSEAYCVRSFPLGKAELRNPDSEMDDKEREKALESYNRVMKRIKQHDANNKNP